MASKASAKNLSFIRIIHLRSPPEWKTNFFDWKRLAAFGSIKSLSQLATPVGLGFKLRNAELKGEKMSPTKEVGKWSTNLGAGKVPREGLKQ